MSDLPTGDEVASLVEQKIITPEEARSILFKSEDDEPKLKQAEEEIKFLRELVDRLTDHKNFKIIGKVYENYNPIYPMWYNKYEPILCNTPSITHVSSSANTVTTAGSLDVGYSTTTNLPQLSSLN